MKRAKISKRERSEFLSNLLFALSLSLLHVNSGGQHTFPSSPSQQARYKRSMRGCDYYGQTDALVKRNTTKPNRYCSKKIDDDDDDDDEEEVGKDGEEMTRREMKGKMQLGKKKARKIKIPRAGKKETRYPPERRFQGCPGTQNGSHAGTQSRETQKPGKWGTQRGNTKGGYRVFFCLGKGRRR